LENPFLRAVSDEITVLAGWLMTLGSGRMEEPNMASIVSIILFENCCLSLRFTSLGLTYYVSTCNERVCQMWKVAASRKKTFRAPSVNTANKTQGRIWA